MQGPIICRLQRGEPGCCCLELQLQGLQALQQALPLPALADGGLLSRSAARSLQ